MLHTWQDFKGEIPRRSRRLLPPGQAVKAVNCNLRSGEIRAFNGLSAVRTPSKGSAVLTIYLWKGVYWLNWLTDVDVALSPVIEDAYERIYWTGDGAYPKKISLALGATDPDADLPEASFRMGVIAPAAAPTTADDAAGGGNPETRVYVYTYVTAWGEEGQPSPPSTALEVEANEVVTVNGFEAAPDSSYNITKRRIYRTLSGLETATYQFVAEIGIGDTSYADSLTGTELGEVLPSLSWAEPPDDLAGLTLMGNGVMAGFSGKDLYFSEAYLPHAWPNEYALATQYDIVGLGVMGRSLVVMTEADTYLVYGEDPSEFSIEMIGPNQPCVSKRGIVNAPRGVFYPSPDGIVMVSPSGIQVITLPFFTRKEWGALTPANLVSEMYQGRYVGFFGSAASEDVRGIIFDPEDPASTVTFLDQTSDAIYADPVTNDLYMVVDGTIVLWDSDPDNPLNYKWRGHHSVSKPHNFGAGAVLANLDYIITPEELAVYQAAIDAVAALNTAWYTNSESSESGLGASVGSTPMGGIDYLDVPTVPSNTIQVSVYADDVLKHQQFVEANEGFRLPSGYLGREWQVEVEGTAALEKIQLGSNLTLLRLQ